MRIPHAIIFFLLLLYSCSKKVLDPVLINDLSYVNVRDAGAEGNGRNDDTRVIQYLFDNEENVYFPEGAYLLGQVNPGIHVGHNLIISDKSKVKNIFFDEKAVLVIPTDVYSKDVNSTVIKIFANKRSLNSVTIHGLKIINQDLSGNTKHTGVFAIEHNDNHVKKLIIRNAVFENLTGSGITTQAKYNLFENIHTKNTVGIGIGAISPYNLGETHELIIDGYISENNQAYCIDFSGREPGNNRKIADPDDTWKGQVNNVKCINSKRGIKTAGHWDLEMDSITIIDPQIYGFFINKDAPRHTINIKNMYIEGSGSDAISVGGKTHLNIKNLQVIDCDSGLNLQKANVFIDGLLIDGKGSSKTGVRINTEVRIDNFEIKGIKDEYSPLWINGKTSLRNGKIINNDSPYSLLVHELASEVDLENIEYYDDRDQPVQKNGILKLTPKSQNIKMRKMKDEKLIGKKIIQN